MCLLWPEPEKKLEPKRRKRKSRIMPRICKDAYVPPRRSRDRGKEACRCYLKWPLRVNWITKLRMHAVSADSHHLIAALLDFIVDVFQFHTEPLVCEDRPDEAHIRTSFAFHI